MGGRLSRDERLALLLSLLLAAMALSLAPSTADADPIPDSWRSDAEEVVAEFDPGDAPGFVVSLTVADERWTHVAGWARVEPEVALSAGTPMRMASVSKPMFAVGLMTLVDADVLTLDDPVDRWLDGFPYPAVTVRHLLQHSAGLPDYETLERALLAADDRPDNAALLEFLVATAPELAFEPGTRAEYSNVGYDLLALVIEAASKRSVADHMAGRVFGPLEMTSTRVWTATDADLERARALGYIAENDRFELDDAHPLNAIVGAGGVFSTADDMSHWHRVLEPGVVLSDAALATMLTPSEVDDEYGLGWVVFDDDDDVRWAMHTGSWAGFETVFLAVPSHEISVAVMSNGDVDPEAVADALLERALSIAVPE